jgi:rhamnosyltransferase subunit B
VRVVLSCWGSYGDLFPYLGLARGLADAGHVPVVATCPLYRDLVCAEGFEFRPVGPDIDPADRALIGRVMDPAHGTEVIVRELLVPAVREAYADLTAAVAGADLLLTHPVTFAGPLVAEARTMPWLSTVLSPISFFSSHDLPILPPWPGVARIARRRPWAARLLLGVARRVTRSWTAPVRDLRRELGLADRGDPLYEGQFSPFGTLALFSRRFAAPQADWPSRTTVTGFAFYNRPAALSADTEGFLHAGEPPLVFTLGSSAVGAPGGFFEQSVEAAGALGRRALLLVGLNERWASRPAPAGVHVVDYAPHDLVFARASAIIHHGGIGTAGQGLRSGKPMLVVPHAHDQYDNAFRVAALGVAGVLDARRYTARRVVTRLRRLLDDPGPARQAAQVSRVIGAEDGIGAAVAAIDAFASGSAPRRTRRPKGLADQGL